MTHTIVRALILTIVLASGGAQVQAQPQDHGIDTNNTTSTGPVVNVNTATAEQLAWLPGVGAVKAQAIVDSRPYATVSELVKAKGIGEKTAEYLREWARVDGETTATGAIKGHQPPVRLTVAVGVEVEVECNGGRCTVTLEARDGGLYEDSIQVQQLRK